MDDAPDYDEYAAANASGDDQLTPSDTLTGDDRLDPLDAGYSPPDREPRAVRYGVTADEEARGESLDDKLAEEEPDLSDADDDEDTDFDDFASDSVNFYPVSYLDSVSAHQHKPPTERQDEVLKYHRQSSGCQSENRRHLGRSAEDHQQHQHQSDDLCPQIQN